MLIGIELSDIVDVYQSLSLVWNWKSSKPLDGMKTKLVQRIPQVGPFQNDLSSIKIIKFFKNLFLS